MLLKSYQGNRVANLTHQLRKANFDNMEIVKVKTQDKEVKGCWRLVSLPFPQAIPSNQDKYPFQNFHYWPKVSRKTNVTVLTGNRTLTCNTGRSQEIWSSKLPVRCFSKMTDGGKPKNLTNWLDSAVEMLYLICNSLLSVNFDYKRTAIVKTKWLNSFSREHSIMP